MAFSLSIRSRPPLHGSRLLAAFLLMAAMALSACSRLPPAVAPTSVTVQLSWLHQAEFAGLYAADQQGYFKEEGLDVSFLQGGVDVDYITPVVNGDVQFGIAQPADLITARAAGQPIRSIATIYRRSPIVFFALADSGITRPQDFVGKTIRTAVTTEQVLRAMMAKLGIRPDQYQTMNLPSDVEQFASGDVPVWSGFSNVFVIEVQRAGYPINIIYPDDYGIHFYGDVLITTDDLIEKKPDLVKRFTRAVLRGWEFAVENPELAGAFVQKYDPNADVELEKAKVINSIPLVNTGEDHIGWMQPNRWDAMAQTLLEQGIIPSSLDVSQVYTMQFLEEIYGR